ncbi:hypothetical protein D5086_027462 [Populus alba]|uniref:Uncharacterized protein n=2 Tax=Populus TaxID=3689 RepID=A0ACC4AWQ7_POPAL|nr:hypothetical protein POTOM_049779 [Populus tomentosa]
MGQVKILKRGKEDLIEPGKKDETPRGSHNTQAVKSESLGFVSTDMLGPDVVLVPTQKTDNPVAVDASSEIMKLLGLGL